MPPAYQLSDLVVACSPPASVFVTGGAMLTARTDFNLQTQTAVHEFIAAGGLERPSFINTTPWQNNPNLSPTVMIDAYSFFSGSVYASAITQNQPRMIT